MEPRHEGEKWTPSGSWIQFLWHTQPWSSKNISVSCWHVIFWIYLGQLVWLNSKQVLSSCIIYQFQTCLWAADDTPQAQELADIWYVTQARSDSLHFRLLLIHCFRCWQHKMLKAQSKAAHMLLLPWQQLINIYQWWALPNCRYRSWLSSM